MSEREKKKWEFQNILVVLAKGYDLFSLKLIGSANFWCNFYWLYVLDYSNFYNTKRW